MSSLFESSQVPRSFRGCWRSCAENAIESSPRVKRGGLQVFVFLDGLELRIRDFEEAISSRFWVFFGVFVAFSSVFRAAQGCWKLSQAERRLERCLEDMESRLELEAVQEAGLAGARGGCKGPLKGNKTRPK